MKASVFIVTRFEIPDFVFRLTETTRRIFSQKRKSWRLLRSVFCFGGSKRSAENLSVRMKWSNVAEFYLTKRWFDRSTMKVRSIRRERLFSCVSIVRDNGLAESAAESVSWNSAMLTRFDVNLVSKDFRQRKIFSIELVFDSRTKKSSEENDQSTVLSEEKRSEVRCLLPSFKFEKLFERRQTTREKEINQSEFRS